jgi:hypothetical protein
MERKDSASVCQLLVKVFPNSGISLPEWKETLNWMYFSPAIKDSIPRALVIADQHSIVGHIGLTLSEFTDGERSFKVVQTGNWAVDPDRKAGLLSLRLMLEATSFGDVAIIIGGSPDTQRIVPKIGFKKQLEIDRYIKVMKPHRFLRMARSNKQLVRNVGKLMIFLVGSPLGLLQDLPQNGRRTLKASYEMLETNGLVLDAGRYLTSEASNGSRPTRKVMRNALSSEFLNWYKQCPRGVVHVLRCFREGAVLGHATVMLKFRKGNCYANILNVDTNSDDESAWLTVLDVVEDFLREKEVTHVNALGTYAPWRRALRCKGYCKLKTMPFWLRDKSHKLADVKEWHLTAIEGDLGYLFE